VDMRPVVLLAQLCEQQADLVAVAGVEIVEEVHGESPSGDVAGKYRITRPAVRGARFFAEAKLFLCWPWQDDSRPSTPCVPSKRRRVSAASSRPRTSCACPPRP